MAAGSEGSVTNSKGVYTMQDLIKDAEQLSRKIRAWQKEIDNPSLVISILNELDFFIENVGEVEE